MSDDDFALPPCPRCASEYTYESGPLLTCSMCGHEWAVEETPASAGEQTDEPEVRDAVGNVLTDGDSVVLVKSVKIAGGGGGTVKAGTKVPGIRLIADRGDGHDIDAKVPGLGRLKLKSSVVKRS
ncbi:zinc ribbon domain-containing protein YjdM [Gordonia hirsuta]|nr:zinc ribbon domain-containing protein YjdM [Gordonia hirsuta]